MLRFIKQSKLHNDLQLNSFSVMRYLSTKLEYAEKKELKQRTERRYARPESSQLVKISPDDFVMNLFKGHFNKDIFHFPSIFRPENVDSLLKHGFEIEGFINKNYEKNSVINLDTVKELNKIEAFGLSLSQKYGGLGYSESEVKFIQECAGVNFNIAKFLINNDIGCKLLNDFGSEEQKEKYLPRLASGESFITLAYLENSPLVDLTAIEASAVYNENKKIFFVNGYKKLVHNANISDLILVLAKTSLYENYEQLKSNYSMFIVEKNTPGITVNQLKASGIRDLDLYEIGFDKVELSESNLIKTDVCGSSILKTGVGFGELGTAVICLSTVKKLIHSIIGIVEEKSLMSRPLKQYDHATINVGEINAFAFALESVIYFCAGRYDNFEEGSDMFPEFLIAKIFAVTTLQLAVEKYIQLLGPDCFKSNELLKHAQKVLLYATTFNENTTYLKLLFGNLGLIEGSKPISPVIKKVKKPDENPIDFFKWVFRPDNRSFMKKKINLKMELNKIFTESANSLEEGVLNFEMVFKNAMSAYGALMVKEEIQITRIAEIVVYIYACTAALTRASDSFCNNLSNTDGDINAAIAFTEIASREINFLCTQISHYMNINEVVRHVGEMAFDQKQYPVAHPLIRTY